MSMFSAPLLRRLMKASAFLLLFAVTAQLPLQADPALACDSGTVADILGTTVRVRLTTHAMRTIEHNGGLDAFLLSTPNRNLPEA